MTDYSRIVPDETLTAWSDSRSKERWALVLDEEDGPPTLHCRTSYGGDGTPMDEWHGRTLRYGITAEVIDNDSLRQDLAEGGKLSLLIDRIHAGHSTKWNGNNFVGTLTEDAEAASLDLSDALDSGDYNDTSLALWDASEWFSGDGSNDDADTLDFLGLTVDSDDAAIEAAIAKAEVDARSDGAILVSTGAAVRGCIERERERLANVAA